jgi:hypothetical protein
MPTQASMAGVGSDGEKPIGPVAAFMVRSTDSSETEDSGSDDTESSDSDSSTDLKRIYKTSSFQF